MSCVKEVGGTDALYEQITTQKTLMLLVYNVFSDTIQPTLSLVTKTFVEINAELNVEIHVDIYDEISAYLMSSRDICRHKKKVAMALRDLRTFGTMVDIIINGKRCFCVFTAHTANVNYKIL